MKVASNRVICINILIFKYRFDLDVISVIPHCFIRGHSVEGALITEEVWEEVWVSRTEHSL